MNIEFCPAEPVVERQDIIVDGVKIGWIELMNESKYRKGPYWHCGINLPGRLSLIQGFGSTEEEAINAALVDGRQDANRLLAEIASLENRLTL